MADVKPIKGVYNTGDSVGLAELTATDTIGIVDGGTGGTTATGAKTNLALENVDNTSDADKPISTATQTALDTKATVFNQASEPVTYKAGDIWIPV